MRYRYWIAGRTPGVVGQECYDGEVEADNGKGAMLKALTTEFGETGAADPATSLTRGWVDAETLEAAFAVVGDDSSRMDLVTDDHSFSVEVLAMGTEALAPDSAPDAEPVPYAPTFDPSKQLDAAERISALIRERIDGQTGGMEGRLSEDDCKDLGDAILYEVLRLFRPDLFTDAPVED